MNTYEEVIQYGYAGTRGILAIVFTAVLVKVRLGSKYAKITSFSALLLLNNIFGFWQTFPTIKLEYSNEEDAKEIVKYNIGITFALMSIPFNIAHWELAWLYRTMANDIPKVLD